MQDNRWRYHLTAIILLYWSFLLYPPITMVAITKKKDLRFTSRCNDLKTFIIANGGKLPGYKDNISLYLFIAKLRTYYRRNPMKKVWFSRIPILLELGVDITAGATVSRTPKPTNVEPFWRFTLNIRRITGVKQTQELHVAWLKMLAKSFPPTFLKTSRFNTLEEFVIKSIRVGDITPESCTRDKPVWELRHTLSYVVFPFCPSTSIFPSWRFTCARDKPLPPPSWTVELPAGNSVFFKKEDLGLNQKLFQDVIDSLPAWITYYYSSKVELTKQELVAFMTNDNNFFDHFPISRNGTNPIGGTVINTSSLTNKSPKRMTLFDKVTSLTHHNSYGCQIQDGYTYSNGSLDPFFGGRSLQSCPAIASLKVAIWQKVYNFLSPVSRVCPPNGIQTLLYLGDFDGRINTHRDMNPRSRIKGEKNSQLIGSSVIVVSFFDTHVFEMCQAIGNKRFKVIDSFLTGHCSVYVLDPNDDKRFYHRTHFQAGNKAGKIRYALTLRWLSSRGLYFGPNNANGLAHCMAVSCPKHVIKQHYSKSTKAQAIWLKALQDKKGKARKRTIEVNG